MMCSILRRINRPIQEFVKPLKQTLARPCSVSSAAPPCGMQRVCLLVFDPKLNDKDLDPPLEWREQPLWFLRVCFFVDGIRQQPPRQAWTQSRMSFPCKCNNWHRNAPAWSKKNLRDRHSHCSCNNFSLSAQTNESERLKEEESKRHSCWNRRFSKYFLLLMQNLSSCSVPGKVEVSTRSWRDAGYRM